MIPDGTIVDGKYRILRLLGGGAMGKVYQAEKVTTHERFAIKFIHDYLITDETYTARFEREVNALRGIRHPHVVDVYDWKLPVGGGGGSAYIVMEYLEGESLQQMIQRPAGISVAEVIRVMLQVLDGLIAVHALGIVHRDLSPANVYLVGVDPAWRSAKILDFGLAKGEVAASASDTDGGVTQDGTVLGRAAYAAPEMFFGVELDERADVFACGMMLYRALARRFPYRESKTELMWVERYSQRFEEGRPYPSARSFVPSIPAAVDHVIAKAIRKRPSERYQSAAEMQRDLVDAEAVLLRTPRVTGAIVSAPGLPAGAAQGGTATRVEVSLAVDGSPTPGPAQASTMASVVNWLRAGAGGSSAVRAAAAEAARRVRTRSWLPKAVAATVLGAGTVAVVLVLVLRSGSGSDTRPAAPQGPAAASAEAAARVAVVQPNAAAAPDATAAARNEAASPDAAADRDGGDTASRADVSATGAAPHAPDEGAIDLVKVTLDGLPPGATATVGGVPAVGGVARVPRSTGSVAVKATAPGYLPYEDELVPSEEMIFFVMMEERQVERLDARVVPPAGGRDAGATPQPQRDAGAVRPPPRDAGPTRPPERDAGAVRPPLRLDGGGGIGIIVDYDNP